MKYDFRGGSDWLGVFAAIITALVIVIVLILLNGFN